MPFHRNAARSLCRRLAGVLLLVGVTLGGCAFAAHGDWLTLEMGMAQGFDTFSSDYRPAEEVLDEAAAWLQGLSSGEPFFLFVHLYDAHSDYGERPYEAPKLDPQAEERLRALGCVD